MPRASPRLRSLNADAFHSTNAAKGPAIIECFAHWQGDDCVNINGRYYYVAASQGRTVRIVAFEQPVRWEILDGVTVTAYTYNGTVPGPMIRVTEGDQVRIVVKNELPDPTTIHWHGVEVPNSMDGVPDVTQAPILAGETFTYEFTAKPAGTFMYHSHYEGDIQVMAGLYAPFIIDPKEPEANPPTVDEVLMISEWLFTGGQTFAAMPMSGMEPNYFTINGKALPDTEKITVKKGDRVRLRFIAIGQFIHGQF